MNKSIVFLSLAQLIFSQRCTEAEGRRWHENHFCCQDCAGPLGGGRYALPGGSPCCPSCFKSRYTSAGSSSVEALEGQASLGKGGDGADLKGRGRRLSLAWKGLISPARTPRPIPTMAALPAPAATRPPTATPRREHRGPAALTARSKGLLNPPGGAAAPTRSRAGDAVATGGWRRGPLGRTGGSGGAHGTARGGAGGRTQPWPASCTGTWGL